MSTAYINASNLAIFVHFGEYEFRFIRNFALRLSVF